MRVHTIRTFKGLPPLAADAHPSELMIVNPISEVQCCQQTGIDDGDFNLGLYSIQYFLGKREIGPGY